MKILKDEYGDFYQADSNNRILRKLEKARVNEDIDSLKIRIDELKLIKQDDAKLLKWAKDNYDSVTGLDYLKSQLQENKDLLLKLV